MADLSAYNPWAAPVFPNRDDNAMQPETYSNPLAQGLLSQLAGAIGRGFMAPGQALQSTTPITSGQMVAPAMDMAGMTTLGAGAIPQEANTLNMGIKAYHGSPHDFNAFSMDKIGTGEGAQAYGHGLYFADNEGVAKSYRDALSPRASADVGAARSALNQALVGQAKGSVSADGVQSARQALDAALQKADPGHMYEVNINADPAHFLDWDKPLYEQPAAYDKIKAHADQIRSMGLQDTYKDFLDAAEMRGMPGSDFVNIAQKGGREALTADLKDAGIPGIKYLDQGSRDAGQGSSNYVVFNDKLIDILRKYAVPGMMGAPIFASQLGEQKS